MDIDKHTTLLNSKKYQSASLIWQYPAGGSAHQPLFGEVKISGAAVIVTTCYSSLPPTYSRRRRDRRPVSVSSSRFGKVARDSMLIKRANYGWLEKGNPSRTPQKTNAPTGALGDSGLVVLVAGQWPTFWRNHLKHKNNPPMSSFW